MNTPVPYIGDRVQSFDTLAAATAYPLQQGQQIVTQGYNAFGDGGGNTYRFNTGPIPILDDGGFFIEANSGYLEAIDKSRITSAQAGIFSGGDIQPAVQLIWDSMNTLGGGHFEFEAGQRFEFANKSVRYYSNMQIVGNDAVMLNTVFAPNSSGTRDCNVRDLIFEKTNPDLIGTTNYQGLSLNGQHHVYDNIRFYVSGAGTCICCLIMGTCSDMKLSNFYFGPDAGGAGVSLRGSNVHLSKFNLDYAQADDGIALKATSAGCENWTISDIICRGAAAAVTLGSESRADQPMQNITVSNVVAENCARAVYVKCGYGPVNGLINMGGQWRNLQFQNINLRIADTSVLQDVDSIINIAARKEGSIDGLVIDGVTCQALSEASPSRDTNLIQFELFGQGGETPAIRNAKISNVNVNKSVPDVANAGDRSVSWGVRVSFTESQYQGEWDASGGGFPATSLEGGWFRVTGLNRSQPGIGPGGAELHDGDVLLHPNSTPATSINDFELKEVEDIRKKREEDQQYQGQFDASSGSLPAATDKRDYAPNYNLRTNIQIGDWWKISVAGTLGGTAVDIGDTLTATVVNPTDISEYTVERVEDQTRKEFELDCEIDGLMFDRVENNFLIGTNDKLRISNVRQQGLTEAAGSADGRSCVLIYEDMPELRDYKITGPLETSQSGIDFSHFIPNPSATQRSRTYSGPELAIPAWMPSYRFSLGVDGLLSSGQGFSTQIPIETRFTVPKYAWIADASIPSDPANELEITISKMSARFNRVLPVMRWNTTDRPLVAGQLTTSHPGYHVAYEENFVYNDYIGQNSYFEPNDYLMIDLKCNAGSVVVTNLYLFAYYFGF